MQVYNQPGAASRTTAYVAKGLIGSKAKLKKEKKAKQSGKR